MIELLCNLSLTGAEPTTPGGRASFSLRWVYSDRMYPVMKSLFKMGLIMFYFYLCDRLVSWGAFIQDKVWPNCKNRLLPV